MTQYVICALQMEGFHCWPEADGELAYLKNSHRHIFFITAEFPVHNANREIEIISQQNAIKRYLLSKYGDEDGACHFGRRSCEDIAAEILNQFKTPHPAPSLKMGLGVRELFDNNIKVHFAGSDGGEIFYAALLAAQTKYRLFSCYKYILKCRPDDDFRLPADHVIRVQDTVNRHVIQDSGLFTLMFGAGKGQTQTLESLTEWQDKLIAFVQQNNLRCTCVELDCQKVLGVREAWYFRERMKKLLDNPQINVFHFEDGMRGLDSLIDFSDYIALSIPELRIIKPKTFREDTRYLTHYIKNRKPEIDIHLLGCTDVKMIAQNSFCTSADSTSWLSGVKYGWFDDGNQKAHINQFRKDLIEQRLSAVRTITEGRGLELTDKTLLYGARASLCATICKQKYTRAAGSQE